MKEVADSNKPQHKKLVEILAIAHLKASEGSYYRDIRAHKLYGELDKTHKHLAQVCKNIPNLQPGESDKQQINAILKQSSDLLSQLTTTISQSPKAQNS